MGTKHEDAREKECSTTLRYVLVFCAHYAFRCHFLAEPFVRIRQLRCGARYERFRCLFDPQSSTNRQRRKLVATPRRKRSTLRVGTA